MSETPAESSPPEPPARSFRFKPREFARDNPPVSAPAPGPTDVREHFLAAAKAPPDGAVAPTPSRENEIHTILRDNLAQANAAGLNDLAPKTKRRSRRLRDYLLVAGLFNAFLILVALKFRDAPIVLVFVLAAFVFANIRFAWSVWVVMDDY